MSTQPFPHTDRRLFRQWTRDSDLRTGKRNRTREPSYIRKGQGKDEEIVN